MHRLASQICPRNIGAPIKEPERPEPRPPFWSRAKGFSSQLGQSLEPTRNNGAGSGTESRGTTGRKNDVETRGRRRRQGRRTEKRNQRERILKRLPQPEEIGSPGGVFDTGEKIGTSMNGNNKRRPGNRGNYRGNATEKGGWKRKRRERDGGEWSRDEEVERSLFNPSATAFASVYRRFVA